MDSSKNKQQSTQPSPFGQGLRSHLTPSVPSPATPGQFYDPPTPPPSASQPYSNLVLSLLATTCLLSFILMGIGGNQNAPALDANIGASLFLGVFVSVLVIDWHGFTTLHGWIKWKQALGKKRFWLWCLYLFLFEIVLIIYLIRTALLFFAPPAQAMGMRIVAPSLKSPRVSLGLIVGTAIALMGIAVAIAAPTTTDTAAPPMTKNAMITQTSAPATPQSTTSPLPPTPPPKPAPTPTPLPRVQPTQVPAPTPPPHLGINGNPWGYDFTPGNLIYQPPPDFCTYFNCIPSFWQNTNGYVDECNDGTYSHSGGVRGACSRHGGEMRPLYSH